MSIWIRIKDCITFAPNIGVMVDKTVLELSPEEIKELLILAYSHMQDELLVDACCGGSNSLSDLGQITFEDYLVRLREIELQEETKKAKKKYTKIRRTQYSACQPQLVLALIERGIPYICIRPECNQTTNLTIDHIMPLSKGGTDELDNLQFMCKSHNSSKGDKINA